MLFKENKNISDQIMDKSYFTGTKVTLKTKPEAEGHNTLKELLAFHAKHYSSNIMSLVVLGAEPVEQLTEMVVEMFSEIVNKNVTVPFYENHPYRPQDLKVSLMFPNFSYFYFA